MTGKKPRPGTEPVYSGGNRDDFPITTGYDSVEYTELLSSHLFNSEDILICQNLCDGYFSGCFALSKRYSPRPSTSWGIRENYDTFIEFVNEMWERKNGRSQNLYSLACDENLGFGVFFMEKFGTGQSIVTNLLDISKKWEEGFKITACAARGSTFYIVMTKGTDEYKGKQTWFTCNSWREASNEIHKNYGEKRVITGICYSIGLSQYFVVMTETAQDQTYKWFDDTTAERNWVDVQFNEGFYPTIIFNDPTVKSFLVVMTTDSNRSGYEYRINYKLT